MAGYDFDFRDARVLVTGGSNGIGTGTKTVVSAGAPAESAT